MLKILEELQIILLPLYFLQRKSVEPVFPFMSIFDAVAPYYPIKFTPPKNDPWKITREALQNALMSVFTCHIYDDKTFVDISSYGDENMIALAVQLVLERLAPSQYGDEGEDITALDQIEALHDLSTLIIAPQQNDAIHDWDERRNKRQQNILKSLSIPIMTELSSTLLRCHEHASTLSISSTNEGGEEEKKQLARSCRSILHNLVRELEKQSKIQGDNESGKSLESLWLCLVSDQISDLSTVILSSPQSKKGQVAINYVALLSASGCERTLRLCLNKCIPIFLELFNNIDEVQVSIAAWGIGLFFSSSKVSMEKINEENVDVHPHPLEEFAPLCVQSLSKLLFKDPLSPKLKSTALKSFGCVLNSSPHFLLGHENASSVRQTVEFIGQNILKPVNHENQVKDSIYLECDLAHAHFVGTVIGTSLKQEGRVLNDEDFFLENDEDVEHFVQRKLLPQILQSSSEPATSTDQRRLDWKTLAFACQHGEMHVAEVILQHLFDALKDTIKSKASEKIQTTSKAISYILHKGGVNSIEAVLTKGLHLELVQFLMNLKPVESNDDIGMSSLMLPEVRRKNRIEADSAVSLRLFNAISNICISRSDTFVDGYGCGGAASSL